MMTTAEAVQMVRRSAATLGEHPQDHGWRELYRLFAYGLDNAAPQLTAMVHRYFATPHQSSHSHFVTLLGIAVKVAAGDSFLELVSHHSPATRLRRLEDLLERHGSVVYGLLTARRNSFTGARRFLVPQVILSAYFAGRSRREVRFADLGTGLGLMPRQLNSRTLFQRFGPNLRWPGGAPAFREIPFDARFGVERPPMPDLAWVNACYGASPYYAALWEELLLALRATDLATSVRYILFDLTDEPALATFLRDHRINCVNVCYALYELDGPTRARVVDTLRQHLQPPKVIIITEPRSELTKPGCEVTFYDDSTSRPLRICQVSDGHFTGHVTPLEDYRAFVKAHPIAYDADLEQESA